MAEEETKAKKTKKSKGGNVDKDAEKANATCHEIDMAVRKTMRSKQTIAG